MLGCQTEEFNRIWVKYLLKHNKLFHFKSDDPRRRRNKSVTHDVSGFRGEILPALLEQSALDKLISTGNTGKNRLLSSKVIASDGNP